MIKLTCKLMRRLSAVQRYNNIRTLGRDAMPIRMIVFYAN